MSNKTPSSTPAVRTLSLDEDVVDEDVETAIDEDAPVALAETDEDVVDEDAELDPQDRLPKHAKRNADGSVTLPLYEPVSLRTKKNDKVREQTFKELVFHRLSGADQRAIAATSDDMQGVVAFARSTRLSTPVMNALFDKMDAADISAGGKVLNNFFAIGPTIGKRS